MKCGRFVLCLTIIDNTQLRKKLLLILQNLKKLGLLSNNRVLLKIVKIELDAVCVFIYKMVKLRN